MEHYASIRRILERVRRRWRTLRLFQASVRVALAGSAVVALALIAAQWTGRAPLALVFVAVLALALLSAVAAWGFFPLRHAPDDARVARYIEEQTPDLDDRLASAVDAALGKQGPTSLAEPMLKDAAGRLGAVDLDTIVSRRALRHAGVAAAAAMALLLALVFAAREPASRVVDAASIALFPSRVSLEVTPGDARIKAGSPFVIQARLVGNRAPVIVRVETAVPDGWNATEMVAQGDGFLLDLPSVSSSFQYRVVAGAVRSPEYEVSAIRPPRVERIDVEYAYPAALGLKPRVEEDGGDIYAPAGTDVKIRIHLDRAAATGQLAMGSGESLALTSEEPQTFAASMRLDADNSYRVTLADADGFSSPGDTEYFIRMLDDRPPEVRIIEPAADTSVTLLEEVDIAAAADDDFGISNFELVYAVRGGTEQVISLSPPKPAPSVTGKQTLYLEDLHVKPGDFVSYYVRARDVARGRKASETKSDLYFLEVKPFDQEFRLAESQAQSGGGSSIDELVNSQKEVVAATWKLERRAQANGARSAEDIKSVGRAQAELIARVEQTASSFREQTMRDPRRRTGLGSANPDGSNLARTMPEEDAMALASAAMARAVAQLDALKTGPAIPPEMEALNHLLKAQADVTEREVSRQQSGNGNANNNRNLDVSSLFDRELQRQQQTNYENTTSSEQSDSERTQLDKIQDLARRQDELLKQQQELAKKRAGMQDEELKRELETLTREQTKLRQQAEELLRQMSKAQANEAGRSTGSSSSGERGQSGSNIGTNQMRDVSDAMRAAAGDLRDDDPDKASANASQALQTLRQLERDLRMRQGPDDQTRALGEAQMEARQLADAQRQLAAEGRKLSTGKPDADALRRLAGEQERLAERARTLEEQLDRQASTQAKGRSDPGSRSSARNAVRELESGQVASHMQQMADDMRSAAVGGGSPDSRARASRQEEIARSLDKVAEGLQQAGTNDNESQKLSAQLARAQELRTRLDALSKEMAPQGRNPATAPNSPEAEKLQQDYQAKLDETRQLMDELRRDGLATSGPGITAEGQGSIMSAPGTEGFKQDFAGWDMLRRQATTALDQAEAALSKKLQAKESKDRLASGVEDKAPAEYQDQVDSYFKALATKKKP